MHLTGQLFNQMAGVNIQLVPYRGTGPATQDVLAGHIPLGVTDLPSSLSLIADKRIKVYGITSRSRFSSFPDIPTFAEQGLSGYESVGWFGFVAPAGTPPDIVAKLNDALVTALKEPAIEAQIRKIGAEPMPLSPADFAGFIRSEIAKWAKVVEASGAKAQ
jgi:tripartite-type tricarboxylate transporter receptor subunit TctC